MYPVPESAKDVIAACDDALRLAPKEWPATLPPSEAICGAPEWYPFENLAWGIGESIRQAFLKAPRLRRDPDAIAKVAEVATCRNLRRGRQSFVMLLGFVGASEYASRLAPFLTDADVDGHVVDTLLKMRVNRYAADVKRLLESDRAWVRRKARKYIERYS